MLYVIKKDYLEITCPFCDLTFCVLYDGQKKLYECPLCEFNIVIGRTCII